jgi:hypothetical protein
VQRLAKQWAGKEPGKAAVKEETKRRVRAKESEAVAIVGMAGRFPGAGNVEEFWRNLEAGVE